MRAEFPAKVKLAAWRRMSELIECIRAEGTMRGVKFRDEAGRVA